MTLRLCFLLFLLPTLASAADAPKIDLTVPAGMVKREFALGHADLALVEQLLADTQSPGGKHHIMKTKRTLIMIDRPEQIEAVRKMLPHLTAGAQNVKIEFVSRSVNQSTVIGGQVQGQVRTGDGRIIVRSPQGTPGVIRRSPNSGIIFDRGGGGAIEVDVLNQSTSGSQLNSSFIMVRAGSEGFIELTRDVPMVDYFTRYISGGQFGAVFSNSPFLRNGLFIQLGGVFEVPEFRWEKVGTRLLVRPAVEGNLIHLEIMPQIRSLVIVDREALRQRGFNEYLTGREQYVTFQGLATSVTVASGQTVPIGGFANATKDFNHFLFGATSSSGVNTGNMMVRATIQ